MGKSDITKQFQMVEHKNSVLAQPLPYHMGIRKQFLGGGKKK